MGLNILKVRISFGDLMYFGFFTESCMLVFVSLELEIWVSEARAIVEWELTLWLEKIRIPNPLCYLITEFLQVISLLLVWIFWSTAWMGYLLYYIVILSVVNVYKTITWKFLINRCYYLPAESMNPHLFNLGCKKENGKWSHAGKQCGWFWLKIVRSPEDSGS